MNRALKCELVRDQKELTEKLKSLDDAYVLFYASWCPYSRKFLPVFQGFSENNEKTCLRMLLDDNDEAADKYGIEVYPTVLFFKKGKVYKRLDGAAGEGLNGKDLTDFVAICDGKGK